MSPLRAALVAASVAVSVVTTTLTATTVAATGAGVPDPPRYQGYVACSAKKSAPAAESCKVGQPKTAFFLSKDRATTYKVCVKFPDKKRLCAAAQQAKKGKKSAVEITSGLKGRHKVTWYVAGAKVDKTVFTVTAS